MHQSSGTHCNNGDIFQTAHTTTYSASYGMFRILPTQIRLHNGPAATRGLCTALLSPCMFEQPSSISPCLFSQQQVFSFTTLIHVTTSRLTRPVRGLTIMRDPDDVHVSTCCHTSSASVFPSFPVTCVSMHAVWCSVLLPLRNWVVHSHIMLTCSMYHPSWQLMKLQSSPVLQQ